MWEATLMVQATSSKCRFTILDSILSFIIGHLSRNFFFAFCIIRTPVDTTTVNEIPYKKTSTGALSNAFFPIDIISHTQNPNILFYLHLAGHLLPWQCSSTDDSLCGMGKKSCLRNESTSHFTPIFSVFF